MAGIDGALPLKAFLLKATDDRAPWLYLFSITRVRESFLVEARAREIAPQEIGGLSVALHARPTQRASAQARAQHILWQLANGMILGVFGKRRWAFADVARAGRRRRLREGLAGRSRRAKQQRQERDATRHPERDAGRHATIAGKICGPSQSDHPMRAWRQPVDDAAPGQ